SEEEINNYPANIDGERNRTQLPGDLISKDVHEDAGTSDNARRTTRWATWRTPHMKFALQRGATGTGLDGTAAFSGACRVSWFQQWEMKVPFVNDGNLNKIFTDRRHRTDPCDRNSAWVPGKYPALRYNDNGHSTNR